jgi:two-component system response regulator HupR/HoxA
VAILAQALLADLAATHGKPVHEIEAAALEFLENYDWPGNLRELANEITRMLIFAQGKMLTADRSRARSCRPRPARAEPTVRPRAC